MDKFVQRINPSTSHHQNGSPGKGKEPALQVEPPAKRVKKEIPDSDGDSETSLSDRNPLRPTLNAARSKRVYTADTASPVNDDALFQSEADSVAGRPTAIESSLPDIKADKEAIEEYETFRASQGEKSETATSRFVNREWVKGKSSLYVDAFNLALSTVLEDESHLFDEKERALFDNWEKSSYEAQYLYVRLFLRKQAVWHRIAKLGYHGDVSDLERAVEELQQPRKFPAVLSGSQPDSEEDASDFAQEEHTLGGSFKFADNSDACISTVDEAITLLSLDELKGLAKDAKVQGKNKADLVRSVCKMSNRQSGLMSVGLRRSSTHNSTVSDDNGTPEADSPGLQPADESNRNQHFLEKIMSIAGPCIRLSLPVLKLFERVHLVFYRSTEWTEKSLTAIILSKISRRNFPEYIVCRSANIFTSRNHLLEFETATRTEFSVDSILEFSGPPRDEGYQKVLDIFERTYDRWKQLLQEEQIKEERVYETGEGTYLRRFSPVHPYTRIIHKATSVLGRFKEHRREHSVLTELLDQRLFHHARRGAWYQRKALLEEHYMYALEPDPTYKDPEVQKKNWKRIAVTTCETALEDPDCHLKYHYDLQKRILKLEKQLRVPFRLQHDFGHVKLKKPEEHFIEGVQLKKDEITGKKGRGPSTKTIWVDEAEGDGECSVEAMCLSSYRCQGWKGYHAEGGIIRTLFAYLFYDILFLYIPNVFQTAYQTCPLDLFTDAFYPTRASEINHRLVEIANGEAARLVQEVDGRERERRTCVVGLNWDYELPDLLELVDCFDGAALATVCKVMAQEYGQRGGGLPDLILWRKEPKEVMFSEVKSANDRLSDTQRLWIHVLTGAGVRVALCNAVAKEVRRV
ncbi:VRR-NUC domain-containing protein [Truncatella angustata]|uniref:Fanconi-associated nuclease n=1 Tax=Truncatella angustata TaxID=152316 RepID=A0A9P8RHZ7_9PEZI|nr:VRR-NUC domain-containing protein [Truncatella angustata]KAH6646373.1 VRR-NUC domain-containing protein [Truncatella angustata]